MQGSFPGDRIRVLLLYLKAGADLKIQVSTVKREQSDKLFAKELLSQGLSD